MGLIMEALLILQRRSAIQPIFYKLAQSFKKNKKM